MNEYGGHASLDRGSARETKDIEGHEFDEGLCQETVLQGLHDVAPNGVSSESTGIAEAVDATTHEEAEGAFNSKDRSSGRQTQ